MRYRERLLVHWTGKDVGPHPLHVQCEDDIQLLVQRVTSIVRDGFWMTFQGSHRVKGGPMILLNEDLEGMVTSTLEYNMDMYCCCFTEIPIPRAKYHAKNYGGIGIALERKAILQRWGAPVHYVRNSKDEVVVWQHAMLSDELVNLEGFYTSIPEDRRNQFVESVRYAQRWHGYLKAFVKEMSDFDTDNFRYIEESEWRVIPTRSMTTESKSELFTEVHDDRRRLNVRKYFLKMDDPDPRRKHYLMPVEKAEIVTIIFPDDSVRKATLTNPEFRNWLRSEGGRPDLITMSEAPTYEPHEP